MSVIPAAALAQHTGILGKTGSGKTSTGKLLVEQVVAGGARVCVLDPIKSDWWGVISSADGKRPGLPFHVLGGPHGHVALHSGAGAAIAELVASGQLPLSVLDMADFEPGGQHRFFVAFAETLLKRMRGVLYLVLEEAHEFAPKERAGFEKENLAIHFAKKLATAGRSKGVRLVLMTQRTQSLHNAMLGSCETMIVHRITAPADQEPVLKWLKANVQDKDVRADIVSSMSSLKTGTGWLCSGEATIFTRMQFPRIGTFDNSATPTDDARAVHVTGADVDLVGLRALIGDAVKDAEANDPKKLKAEIARLEKLISSASNEAPKINTAALDEQSRQITELMHDNRALEQHRDAVVTAFDRANEVSIKLFDHFAKAVEDARPLLGVPALAPFPAITKPSAPARTVTPATARQPTAAPSTSRISNGKGPALSKAETAILRALYWLRDEERAAEKVAFYAGYSVSSSSFANALGALRAAGLVQRFGVTFEGEKLIAPHAGDKPSGAELREWVRPKLGRAENALLDVLVAARGSSIENVALAEASGYSITSSSFANAIGRLRTIGAAVGYDRDGGARAAEVFFR